MQKFLNLTSRLFQGTVWAIAMLELLKKHFGYDAFRPLQQDVIEQCLAKKDALVLMPTGGGKSLCFQLPALMFPGLTIVISPLIALMKDQVDSLQANGVAAACLNSTISAEESRRIATEAREGKLKLLYLAPERLAIPNMVNFLQTLNISLFAIDEAHCISEWGHDFRPDYRGLSQLREVFPGVPVMALTATANERVKNDIIAQLKIEKGRIFQSSFNRGNLTYRVLPKKKVFEHLFAEIQERQGQSIIIYCFSRKGAEGVAEKLLLNGVKAAAYHAGLTPQQRTQVQDDFIRDRVPVIAATIAFGMGIDKPDVRLVVHTDLPKSVEGYYQETGRAGRDGLPSECLLFFSKGDCFKQELFIREMTNPEERQRARKQLDEMTRYGDLQTCRRAYLLQYFGEAWNEQNCNGCDICLPPRMVKIKIEKGGGMYDQALFDLLRAVRRELAEARAVPPYVIFGDKSLQEMAQLYPQSPETFGRIFGVGKEKLVQYGASFLKVICAYASEQGRADQVEQKPMEVPKKKLGETVNTTVEFLHKNYSLEDIAMQRKLSIGTIINHLESAIEQGMVLRTDHLQLPTDARSKKIVDAFRRIGTGLLAPIKTFLGEAYSYDELRVARFLYLIHKHDPV